MNTDDSGKIQQFLNDDAVKQMPPIRFRSPPYWSRDGRYIAYDTSLGEEEREVWLLDVTSDKIVPLLPERLLPMGSGLLARWPPDRLHLRRIGPTRDLRASL